MRSAAKVGSPTVPWSGCDQWWQRRRRGLPVNQSRVVRRRQNQNPPSAYGFLGAADIRSFIRGSGVPTTQDEAETATARAMAAVASEQAMQHAEAERRGRGRLARLTAAWRGE